MNQLTVNGQTAEIKVPGDAKMDRLMDVLRDNFLEENQMISSFKIDGVEMTLENEKEMLALPLSAVEKVELQTSTQEEMVSGTIQTLSEFVLSVIDLSRELVLIKDDEEFEAKFLKLIDGLQTVNSTVSAIKMVIRIGVDPKIQVLEADLASILNDLIDARQKKQREFIKQLLGEHLVQNMNDWFEQGLPHMLKRMDNAPARRG